MRRFIRFTFIIIFLFINVNFLHYTSHNVIAQEPPRFKKIAEFKAHRTILGEYGVISGVTDLEFIDNETLVTGGNTGIVKKWKITPNSQSDHTVKIIQKKRLMELSPNGKTDIGITEIEIDPQQTHLATLSKLPPGKSTPNTKLIIQSLSDFREKLTLENVGDRGLSFGSNGNLLAIPSESKSIFTLPRQLLSLFTPVSGPERFGFTVLNLRKNKTGKKFLSHSSEIREIDTYSDSEYVGTGAGDSKISIWDLSNKELLNTFEHNSDEHVIIRGLEFHHSKPFLITSGSDGGIRLWDFKESSLLKHYEMEDKRVHLDLEWVPEKNEFMSITSDGELILWSIDQKEPEQIIEVSGDLGQKHRFNDNPSGLTISPNGDLIAVGRKDGYIQIYKSTEEPRGEGVS